MDGGDAVTSSYDDAVSDTGGPATVSANTTVIETDADLVIAKTVSDGTPDEGDTITYTITLTNNGPAQATNIVVTDVVPGGVTYVAASIAGGDSRSDEPRSL